MSFSSIHERIQSSLPTLTIGQRQMAEYVLANPLRVVSMPINELSEQTGLSVASATRFSVALGFGSYAEFRAELARSLQTLVAPIQRRQEQAAKPPRSPSECMSASLAEDIGHLEETRRMLDTASCEKAVAMMAGARRVFAYGAGQSAFLAGMLANDLSSMGVDAPMVIDSGGGWSAASRLRLAGAKDVVVLIGFPRYARDTVLMAERLALHHIPVIALTDGPRSPLAAHARVMLFARSERTRGKLTSKAAELALIEALLSALLVKLGNPSAPLVEQLDYGLPWLHEQREPSAPPGPKPRKKPPR